VGASELATCLALGCLGFTAGCGASVEGGAAQAGAAPDQRLVPAQLQHRGQLRYFYASSDAAGPNMVLFEDPQAPRLVSLTHPEGRYRAGIGEWSESGRTFAYQLFSEEAGIQPYRFMLSDVAQGFKPQLIEHPGLSERAYVIGWVGERALGVQTGTYHDNPDTYFWTGHYLWIDAQLGSVTELGQIPSGATSSQPFGVDASDEHLWASRFGLVYLDSDCSLVYLEDPIARQTLLNDCTAVASWSADGSFLAVTTKTARQLYQHVGQSLERSALPAAESVPLTARWSWAPSGAKFVLSSSNGSSEPLTTLAVGDASTHAFAPVAELPGLNYATLLSSVLLLASRPANAAQPRATYLADLSQLHDAAPVLLLPLDAGASAIAPPVASSDSQRLYFPEQPLREIRLEGGQASQINTLFSETHPVGSALFRLLNDDQIGLFTTAEPEQTPPGGDSVNTFERNRQYLLNLGSERSVVPLGTFELKQRSYSTGIHTFISAPQLGGILYLGDDQRGRFIDWLGFDDITQRVRLFDASACCNVIDVPRQLAAVTPE
jgi:hypothetical protein